MESNTIVMWAEVELSSTVTIRSAISGWDIVHSGNTFSPDGTLVDIGDLHFALDLENSPFELTLWLGNTDVLSAINNLTYRYRPASVFVAEWDANAAGIVENSLVTKNGYIDTHSDPGADNTVTFTVASNLNLSTYSRGDISSDAVHRSRVAAGVFGAGLYVIGICLASPLS